MRGIGLIRFLIKRFIKDHENVTDSRVREAYALLSGLLGIFSNFILFGVKIGVGLAIDSIAVLSDAVNNLTDLSSSLITIFGVRLGNQPPDQEHPHGHGRIEYIGSLVIAFIILAVGLELLKSSVSKIMHPEPVEVSGILIVILTSTIALKLWMFSYNRYIGRLINSGINLAAATDSLNDAIATSAVILGVFCSKYVAFPIDGIMGLVISCMIMYTGIVTARSAINLLLGASPDPQLVDQIRAIIAKSPVIIDMHDLLLHDYGPGKISGSLHVVVPQDADLVEIHNEIDRIEQQIKTELGIDIVIHMDPGSDPL